MRLSARGSSSILRFSRESQIEIRISTKRSHRYCETIRVSSLFGGADEATDLGQRQILGDAPVHLQDELAQLYVRRNSLLLSGWRPRLEQQRGVLEDFLHRVRSDDVIEIRGPRNAQGRSGPGRR